MGFRDAPPRAAALIESLRGLGYTLPTALADLIDNSIAAGANVVDIDFRWDEGASSIAILDDGKGMSPERLEAAMRLGETNPNDKRSADDLGRFGLGLKTAAFSQGRSLTVASRAEGHHLECLRWDLDVLGDSRNRGWHLLEGPCPGSEERLDVLEGMNSGTLVLLEKLDRLVTPDHAAQDFLEAIDRVERHLGMTFHRYLEGPRPRLKLTINMRPVAPWDPFLTGHAGKPWAPPAISLGDGVEIQCHVLPHKDKLSPAEYDAAAGPDGWTSGQGFYIYRNERLLVAGGWLGLGGGRRWIRDEAHRLARIRLDIPNSADAQWKIDIRKSAARPPVRVRRKLERIAEEARQRARKVFAHRGRLTGSTRSEPVDMAWEAVHSGGGLRYRISREHESVKGLIEEHPELAVRIETMLRCLEETVPVQRIWLDTADQKDTPLTGFAGEPDAEVVSVLEKMFRSLCRKGLSSEEARRRLLRTEPFDRYPAHVAALPDSEDRIGE